MSEADAEQDDDVNEKIKQITLGGTKFVDEEFPTDPIRWQSVKKTKIYWKRPNELCASPSLFGDAVNASHIRQGRIGDCFFIAALSLICSEEEAIRRLFMGTSTLQDAGQYCFQFFQYGRWRKIIIDDQLPARLLKQGKKYRLLLGRSTQNGVFWVSLIEKAYAKLYGSYESIRGGNISEALADLTGAPINDYSLDAAKSKPRTFWKLLLQQSRSGVMIGCALCQKDISNEDDDSDEATSQQNFGIEPNHAYSVLRILDADFAGKNKKLLLVKNPQRDGQRMQFSGLFTDPSKWSEAAKQALSGTILYPGLFWMTWKEFRSQFNRLYICHYEMMKSCQMTSVYGSWNERTSGGCTDYGSWRRNPAFEISGEIVAISLQQPDRRRDLRQNSQAVSYPMIGLTVVKQPANSDNPFLISSSNDILGRTSFWNKRDVAIEVANEWSSPFVVVPSYHEPDLIGEFVMNIYSKGPATINRRQVNVREVHCSGCWKESTSGGGPLSSTFSINPKFILNVDNIDLSIASKPVNFFIGLRQTDIPKSNRHKIGICTLKKAMYALEALDGLQGSLDRSWFLGKATFEVQEEVNRVLEISTDQLPVLIIPCTWEKNQTANFDLTVYTKESESLNSVIKPVDDQK